MSSVVFATTNPAGTTRKDRGLVMVFGAVEAVGGSKGLLGVGSGNRVFPGFVVFEKVFFRDNSY